MTNFVLCAHLHADVGGGVGVEEVEVDLGVEEGLQEGGAWGRLGVRRRQHGGGVEGGEEAGLQGEGVGGGAVAGGEEGGAEVDGEGEGGGHQEEPAGPHPQVRDRRGEGPLHPPGHRHLGWGG